jgi:hypothetical protein
MAEKPQPLHAYRRSVGAAVSRPRAVGVASRLWMVAIATGVIGESIGLFLARRIMRQAIMVVDPGDSQGTVLPPAFAGPSMASALFDLVLFVVTAAVVFAFRDGAHWSRATLTALGVLTVLDRLCLTGLQAALYLAVGPGGRADLVFAAISVVAVLAAIPVMYSAETSRFLRGT